LEEAVEQELYVRMSTVANINKDKCKETMTFGQFIDYKNITASSW